MKEILRTNDMVMVSFVEALLSEQHIDYLVLDTNMSVLEGSIGILPRRVMVAEADAGRARDILGEAGLGHEITTEKKPR